MFFHRLSSRAAGERRHGTSLRRRAISLRQLLFTAFAAALFPDGARLGAQGAAAAAPEPAPTARVGKAIAVGGMMTGASRLAVLKGELSRGKWSLVSDLTRDDTRERWAATPTRIASRDDYVLWASSSAVRRYTKSGARGLYVEGGAGMAQLSLRSRADGVAAVNRKATLAMASWGIGSRTNLGSNRAFVELAYRSAIALQTRHLHAGDVPPEESTRQAVSYQSWFFGRGKASGQLFAALGIRL